MNILAFEGVRNTNNVSNIMANYWVYKYYNEISPHSC